MTHSTIRLSFLLRVGLPLVAIELVTVAILGVAGLNVTRSAVRDGAVDVLTVSAHMIASEVEKEHIPTSPDTPWGRSRLTVMQVQPAGSGQTRGVVVHDSGVAESAVPEMDDHLNRPEIAAALREGAGASVRRSATVGGKLLYAAVRVGGQSGPATVVRLAVPIRSVDASVHVPFPLLVWTGVLLALATLALLAVVERRRSCDIQSLVEAASDLGDGRPARRILTEDIGDDLRSVAQAINSMSDDVSRRIESLEVSESEIQGILHSMGNGVLALDTHQRILNLNRAAEGIFGLTRATCRGHLLAEHIRDPALSAFIDDARQRGRHHAAELELQSIGGRYLDVVSEPLHDGDGQVIGLLLVFNDLTRVRQLEQMRTDFASNVSHELRTPITAIRGYAEVLREQTADDELSQYAAVIERNANRLSAIIEDLLSLARLEKEQDERMDLGMVDLPELVGEIATMLRPLASERSIEVAVDAGDVPPVEGSRQLLEQAIVNLVTNAIRYSGEGASVWVSVREGSPGEVDVSVVDTGPGIAEEHIPRLLERFYRVDRGRSRQEGGTGLGLAIVKHIALVHGGRVEVESRLGNGSVFSIIVPCESPMGSHR